MASKAARRFLVTLSPSEGRLILVRDFIRDALYNPHYGYFSVNSKAVGVLPEPISFSSLKGRRHYMQRLNELYRQNDSSWFTPVELFKPWYGYALARYILRTHYSQVPLQIYEIGGGTGTCAKNILDYMKNGAPLVYDSMHYISVEISKALADVQLKTVYAEETHKSHFSVECRDACKQSGWGEVDERPCFVILLEVLDNQPHDLIYKENSSCPWLETCVMTSESGSLSEVYKPVEDSLIQCCIKIMESEKQSLPSWFSALRNCFHKAFPTPKKSWIPTASLQLLESLYSMHPNLALIVSDFNVLPDVQVEGERAPLVAAKKEGITLDQASYLEGKGDADIFFPTDFELLRKLDRHCYALTRGRQHSTVPTRRQSLVLPVSKFMRQYAEISKTATKDGFNPLLDDYSNMQFFLTRWL